MTSNAPILRLTLPGLFRARNYYGDLPLTVIKPSCLDGRGRFVE